MIFSCFPYLPPRPPGGHPSNGGELRDNPLPRQIQTTENIPRRLDFRTPGVLCCTLASFSNRLWRGGYFGVFNLYTVVDRRAVSGGAQWQEAQLVDIAVL